MARVSGREQATVEFLLLRFLSAPPRGTSSGRPPQHHVAVFPSRSTARSARCGSAVSLSPSPSLRRSTSLIRRIATLGLGIRPPKRGDARGNYLPLGSDAKADQGVPKTPKSGAGLERNKTPLSAEITCRFRPKSGAGLLRFLHPAVNLHSNRLRPSSN